ncbi:S49 family peptidase [Chlamydia caviae]|uniref:Protease IV, putative n=1 Tax=Chlamydia caviae (strain ATCC VR-813 / DSM 19441 / 03DC25 / GPIC) TaxID=227941 RepID=Q824L8_CHLCV|nr:S49 family peptidase [Chlamydia caviae]AAP04879.1 protease IV, putative [Chlamydia caviae GPIC]
MKTFWHFLSKGFLSILGLSFGVVLAFSIILGFVALSSGGGIQFVNMPNAKGEIKDLGKEAPIIAVLEMKDVIASSRHTEKVIQEAIIALDSAPYKGRVKGLIIDMDCPGGEVFEIARVYSTIKFWKQCTKCPVYVFVNGLCASGGYYVACAADKIYSTSSSLIGSVGVLSGPYFNVKEGLSRHGVQSDLLISGKDKAPMNPYTEWTAKDREIRQEIIDYLYGQFVDIVVTNRPLLTKEKLVGVLGARLYSPEKALETGYIDVVNATKQQVLEDLVAACDIENNYRVIGLGSDGWLKKFMSSAANSPLITGKIQHELLPNLDNSTSTFYYLEP